MIENENTMEDLYCIGCGAKIQTEDKALELKLAQLDTEQEALKTEMDAISQTITDTIDKLFDSSK